MRKVLLFITLLLVNVLVVRAEGIDLKKLTTNLNDSLYGINAKMGDDKFIISEEERDLEFELKNNILKRTSIYSKDDYDSAKDLYIYLILTKEVAYLKGYSNKDIEYFLPNLNDASLSRDGFGLVKKDLGNRKIEITYEINLDSFKLILNYVNEPKPEVIIDDVKDSNVTLHVTNTVDKDIDIYRSLDNVHFEYLTTLSVSNGTSSLYVDSDLEGSDYYYKGVVVKANNFSEIKKVTLKEKTSDDDYIDQKTDNPLTGEKQFMGVALLLIVLIIGIINVINLKRDVYR